MAGINFTTPILNSRFGRYVRKGMSNIEQGIINIIPQSTYTGDKAVRNIGKIGKDISSAEQRLILGASALMSQPFIDAHNRSVDEKTRKVSVARTIAKIVAGTFTGYFIRKGCIKAIQSWSKLPAKGLPKYKSVFTPTAKDLKIDVNSDSFKQYQNALGTIAALVVMMVTNFVIDAPLTKYLTNLLVDKGKKHDEKLAKKNGGVK